MVILESPLLFISSSTRLLRITEEDPPEFVQKARLPAHSDLVCAKLADLVSSVWPLVKPPQQGPALDARARLGKAALHTVNR